MRVSLSDEAPPCLFSADRTGNKGAKSGAMPQGALRELDFCGLETELLGVCVDVGIEPPDRLAQLLRILDTHIHTTPGGLCLQTLSETSFGSLDVTSLAPHFSFGFQSHFTESFRILKFCYSS